jgi:protein tyrosine/serine phosphatase
MFRNKTTYTKLTAIVALTFAFAAASCAKTHSDPTFSNIKIKNFGKMDDRLYRGAQPKQEDYKDLAALGVKTVVDLQDSPTSYEKRAAEAVGMRYVNIPMSDSSYPKQESIDTFLKLVNDPSTGVMFIHCAGGRHRTGVIGAVYRFNVNHWTFDQAYSEMKDYDFYTRWGHGDLLTFVQDYAQKIPSGNNAGAAAAATASQKN